MSFYYFNNKWTLTAEAVAADSNEEGQLLLLLLAGLSLTVVCLVLTDSRPPVHLFWSTTISRRWCGWKNPQRSQTSPSQRAGWSHAFLPLSPLTGITVKENKFEGCLWRDDKRVHQCGMGHRCTYLLVLTFSLWQYLGLLQVRMASLTMLLLHLLFVVSTASAWSSSKYQHYYRFNGGSLTFTPKYSNGRYEVSCRSNVSTAHLGEWIFNVMFNIYAGGIPWQADHNLL